MNHKGRVYQAITCYIATSYLPYYDVYTVFLEIVKTWDFRNNYIIYNHRI
jgi:hypothetical protein